MLEGFTGYSLPDDLLSGTGLRFVEGVVRRSRSSARTCRSSSSAASSRATTSSRGCTRSTSCCCRASCSALVTAHLILVCLPEAHPVPGPGHGPNKNVVGMPLLPVYMAKAGGFFFLVFGVIARCSARSPRSTRSGLYGPYTPDPGLRRLPARLVHGLPRGRAPHDARLGDQHLGPHASAGTCSSRR